MSRELSPLICDDQSRPNEDICSDDGFRSFGEDDDDAVASISGNAAGNGTVAESMVSGDSYNSGVMLKKERPSRACTARAAAKLYESVQIEADHDQWKLKYMNTDTDGDSVQPDLKLNQKSETSKMLTSLVSTPSPTQLVRWSLRSMWELASILNFLNIFRHLLNISAEFSAEEFETALISPNDTLSDIHIPILKAIPPITRMALGRDTWVTVLCRKLKDWWHWVADGDIPVVASHGVETATYNNLSPSVRVVILKALCDIRVEQEDIRNYIDSSLKQGALLSTFRKERFGGDSHGVHYWFENDSVIGQRLYREIRKPDDKKEKKRSLQLSTSASHQWETVATNIDEFYEVSEKLLSSVNRTEISLAKKLKVEVLPEIEKVHKKKERLLKKQHRQALMLDSFIVVDGLAPGRSLRDRKPVTYTFDDFDRSINEAIKITKRKPPSPDTTDRKDAPPKATVSINGKSRDPSPNTDTLPAYPNSPKSDSDEVDEDMLDNLDRGTRRRKKPQRYSDREYVEEMSEQEEGGTESDDIVGEAVYDEEYLKKKSRRRISSSSEEGDEEYSGEEEEEEEEEEETLLSSSEESGEPRKLRKLPTGGRRGREKGRTGGGLRRSKRAARGRVNYSRYDYTESERATSSSSGDNPGSSPETGVCGSDGTSARADGRQGDKRAFLDLNQAAPSSGVDDGRGGGDGDEGGGDQGW